MIDFEKIGQRIAEQRKNIHHLSQEKLAMDLGMYQADISNIEKAKSGSGIADLTKLDFIAEYFGIPTETLIFGGSKTMQKYYGQSMQPKLVKKVIPKEHAKLLAHLTGYDPGKEKCQAVECGPYTVYAFTETQQMMGADATFENGRLANPMQELPIIHLMAICNNEVIGVLVAPLTTIMQHVYQPSLKKLQMIIQPDILDVKDVYRTLNPWWALYMLSELDEKFIDPMVTRMDELRKYEDMPIFYIESVYVREDCRRNGVCRLLIDSLHLQYGECIMWLNLEPTAGEELSGEYECVPTFTQAELGQMHMNAAIAEHLGFTVDSDTWHRQVETVNANGEIKTETVLVQKCAYILPDCIKEILKNDGELVAEGRAVQKLQDRKKPIEQYIDMYNGKYRNLYVQEAKISDSTGFVIWIYAAVSKDLMTHKYGVVNRSMRKFGYDQPDQLESYDNLQDAVDSEYYDMLCMCNQFAHLLVPN